MTVRFETRDGYPEELLVVELCELDDVPYPIDSFEKQLKHQRRIFGCYAYFNERLIGYKIGYEPRPRYFESWLGAVDLEHRRQGIAEKLMNLQHTWCEDQGYRYITTMTAATNNPMLILNLKSGFSISGTLLDRGNNYKVLLQKAIAGKDEDGT